MSEGKAVRDARIRRLTRALAAAAPSRGAAAAMARVARAVASGDLTRATLDDVPKGEGRAALASLIDRTRELVRCARATATEAAALVSRSDAAWRPVLDHAARQRVALDRALEEARRAGDRARELAPWVEEVSTSAERIEVLALNAGIEGVRAGGESARAMISLGEEIRRLAQRASTSAESLAASVGTIERAMVASVARLEEARASSSALGAEATRASASIEGARGSLDQLRETLAQYRLLDDDTEAMVGAVTTAAERLASELQAVRARLDAAGGDHAARDAVDRAVRAIAALDRGA